MFEKESVDNLKREYRQSYASIEAFVDIQTKILDGNADTFIVSVEETEYIAEGLMILLGTFPELSVKNKKAVKVRFRSQSKFKDKLEASGVLQYYKKDGKGDIFSSDDKIQFCRPQTLEEYLGVVEKIMKMAPVKFEDDAYTTMSSKLYEVFDNAITHGKNEIGVFAYGDVSKDKFVFSVYDLGVGIQANVNEFTKENYSTREAMEWAMKSGNSTKRVDYPRGAGFTLLESFIKVNNGTMILCSDDIICKVTKKGKFYYKMKNKILGTLFIMNIRADRDSIYSIRR